MPSARTGCRRRSWKQDECGDVAVEWHLIGTLQRNKVRHVVGRFVLIHSIDRLDLAKELDRRIGDGAVQSILVQVNCSDEPQKGGVEPDTLTICLPACARCSDSTCAA